MNKEYIWSKFPKNTTYVEIPNELDKSNIKIEELQEENKQLKILIENIKLGVVLNDEQEKLLDKVLGDSND